MMATVHATAPHTLPSPAMYFPPPRRSSSTLQPPSVSFGDSKRPCVELHKPVWVVDYDCNEAVVTGEIEVNTSLFPRGAPFAIGVELKSPADSMRSEWNHDGPNNRPGSFIQLGQRLAVDESAFTTVTLSIPRSFLPASQHGRVFILSCCAFLIDDPRVKTEMNVAKFMVVRRAPSPSPRASTEEEVAPCSNEGTARPDTTPRTWMGKRRVGGAWGKVAKW